VARPISVGAFVVVVLVILAFDTWLVLRMANGLANLCGEPLSRLLFQPDTPRCF
jgi:hypothetical protein